MKIHSGIRIDQAARQLGVGSITLFRLLRQAGVLAANNLPRAEYIERGYFLVSHRSHPIEHTSGTFLRYYTVTTVTGAGMSLLADIVDNQKKEAIQ